MLCVSCVATVCWQDPILSTQTQEAAAVAEAVALVQAETAANDQSARSSSGVVTSVGGVTPAESMEGSPSAPARARACPCGGAYLVRRTLGSADKCSQCERERNRGCQIWECGACNRRLCPPCKEARPYWKGRVDTPMDTPRGEVDHHRNGNQVAPPQTDEMSLGAMLSKLPAVVNVHTSDGIPKRARSRIGRLASKLLEDLLMAMSAGAGTPTLKEKALMLNHLFPAILRSERAQVQDATCPKDAAAEPATWKLIRSRLQLAEAGRWKEVFCGLLEDVEQLSAAGGRYDWLDRTCHAEDSADVHARRKLTAAGKVKGGCVRTAAQILKGDGLLEPSVEIANQVQELLVTELTASESRDQEAALREAWDAGADHRVIISDQLVRQRVEKLRLGAQPGGSRTRNDLLSSMVSVPGGVASLRAWSQAWADGLVPQAVVETLTKQVLRPLTKPNGKPRPIALLEVFFKIASGCVQDAIRLQPDGEGLDWNQYGGHPAGPELMLMVGQGMMKLAPSMAYMSLDMANAYGRAKRASMLRGTAKWCKAHCRFLCSLWSAKNEAWVEYAPGQWKPFSVVDGAFQGDTSSTPSFSRAMRLAVEEIEQAARMKGIWMQALSLVDDLLLVADPSRVDELVEVVDGVVRRILGTELNRAKCKVFIPERSQQGLGNHPSISSVEQVEGGLPALGSAYAGEFEAVFGPYSVASEPARKRLATARVLAEQCAEYSLETHAAATKQAAWCILQKCGARALQYDVRTLEPQESIPLAEELDRIVESTARTLLGPLDNGWNEVQEAQLRWPCTLSGAGMGRIGHAARVGRLSCLLQCLPSVREHLTKIFPEAEQSQILEAVPLDGAEGELHRLREEGIELSLQGKLAHGSEPRLNLRVPFQACRGVLGLLTRTLAEAERSAYLARGVAAGATEQQRRDTARLHSCEAGASHWVEAIPSRVGLRLNDAEFATGMRHRLGLPQLVQNGAKCQLKAEYREPTGDDLRSSNVCGQFLDPFMDHALCCQKGGGFYRVHGSLCRALANIGREAGCEVTSEEIVPELLSGEPGSDEAVEARLDLHVWAHPPFPAEWFVDVTHHHAWAVRQRSGQLRPGKTAEEAEARKYERYGPGRGGVSVTPAAVESWGRLGPEFEKLLRQLNARWGNLKQADASACAATSRRWKAELGVAQVRAMHVTCMRAARGVTTTPHGHDAANSEDR